MKKKPTKKVKAKRLSDSALRATIRALKSSGEAWAERAVRLQSEVDYLRKVVAASATAPGASTRVLLATHKPGVVGTRLVLADVPDLTWDPRGQFQPKPPPSAPRGEAIGEMNHLMVDEAVPETAHARADRYYREVRP